MLSYNTLVTYIRNDFTAFNHVFTLKFLTLIWKNQFKIDLKII